MFKRVPQMSIVGSTCECHKLWHPPSFLFPPPPLLLLLCFFIDFLRRTIFIIERTVKNISIFSNLAFSQYWDVQAAIILTSSPSSSLLLPSLHKHFFPTSSATLSLLIMIFNHVDTSFVNS